MNNQSTTHDALAPLLPGLDHIANFLNALDTEGMTTSEVRSAIYSECLEPGCKSALRPDPAPKPAPGDVVNEAKYADMDIDQKANAMADDCVGDPWELLGYFREKLRQSQWETDHAREAAMSLAKRAALSPETAKSDALPLAEGGDFYADLYARKCGETLALTAENARLEGALHELVEHMESGEGGDHAGLIEALKTARDYVSDAALGHLAPIDASSNIRNMAAADLVCIDAALADNHPNAREEKADD
jgi:hypothetical protein